MQNNCLSCDIVSGKVDSLRVYENKYFHAHQDYGIPIPGFVVISSKRHLRSMGDFNSEEQQNFGVVLYKVRLAMIEALGIHTVYTAQKERDIDHFHFWILPRHEWIIKKFGNSTASISNSLDYAKEHLKTPENFKLVEESAEKLYKHLNGN